MGTVPIFRDGKWETVQDVGMDGAVLISGQEETVPWGQSLRWYYRPKE